MAQRKVKIKIGWKGQLLVVSILAAAAVFYTTTIILLVGMLPAIVAAIADKTREKTMGMTVGAMNLAGCTPFILDLWLKSNSHEQAFETIANPFAIVIMYTAAALGYMIDWVLTGIVSTFMVQKAKSRLQAIDQRQADLVERWGREITGEVPLDAEGFPVEPAGEKTEPTS